MKLNALVALPHDKFTTTNQKPVAADLQQLAISGRTGPRPTGS